MTSIFWMILGLGVAIPGTIVLIVNMVLSLVAKDNYTLDLKKIGMVYFITLLGYATVFGIEV
jgi:hypothetical protein